MGDNRRLLFSHGNIIYLLDRDTGEFEEIFSAEPEELWLSPLPADRRTLYFIRSNQQSDIWMVELK